MLAIGIGLVHCVCYIIGLILVPGVGEIEDHIIPGKAIAGVKFNTKRKRGREEVR